MKQKRELTRSLLFFMSAAIVVFTLGGCSDDESKTVEASAPKKAVHNPFDHSHDENVTDMVKHKFEHAFADACIDREARNSTNLQMDRDRFEKPCMCIAQYLMKDLTADEAEIFIEDHKNTQSLRIRFDNAAYHCLQEKQALPKPPKLFGKP